MGRFIVRVGDSEPDGPWYLEWSTVADAPVSAGMSRGELVAYIQEQYGAEGLRSLPDRLARVDATGTSAIDDTRESVLAWNRAGPDETTLDEAGIVDEYCREVEGG